MSHTSASSSRSQTPSSERPTSRLTPLSSPSTSVLELQLKTEGNLDRCNTAILDLGDVLFTWKLPVTPPSIPKAMFHKFRQSITWFEYDKGTLKESEVYERLASEFSVPLPEIISTFQAARMTLAVNREFLDFLKQLKTIHNVTLFAMSNVSAEDWVYMRAQLTDEEWGIFDRVFKSFEAGERKPNPGFFKQVLESTRVDPSRTIFVDDTSENILTARSVGLHGIHFDTTTNVIQKMMNLVFPPIPRAQKWLVEHCKTTPTTTNVSVNYDENFSAMLIYESTGDRSLVDFVEYDRFFNFFKGQGILTNADYPCDLDTTAVGLSVCTHLDHKTKMSIMDEMLRYRSEDGIIETYFSNVRPRIDPIVCANVLTAFHMYGRGSELLETQDWVYSVLLHRAYLDGTLYYSSGDAFLFFLSRLLSASRTAHQRFGPLFSRRVVERFGASGDALSLAMRIIAAATVGIPASEDCKVLRSQQEADGSWPVCWVYRYPGKGISIGNKALSTAYALQAIKMTAELNVV